jgi:sugar lactone lactonase YvrE
VGFLTGGVIKYSAEQLETSSDSAPEVIIQGTALVDLGDLLFDADGNLWTAAYTSNRINRYSPEQLDESDPNLTPDFSWTWSTARGPVGLALRNGSTPTLWGTFYDTSELVEFELDTAAGTDPAEATTITSTIFDGGPEQLTFDEQGNVWIGLYDANEFVRIDAADLVTGDQTPAAVIGGNRIKTAYGIRFNPPAE